MSDRAKSSVKLRERALDEFKAFVVLSLYLYICLGAVILYKSAILSSVGIDFTIWGIAAIKAMVLAKFMLLARMLHIEQHHRNKPLIWPICNHAFVFLLVLLALTTIEELVIGALHRRSVIDSLGHVVGSSVLQAGATCIIMFLILAPYSAFICLADALGEREVFRLFFIDRSMDNALHDRLTGRVPTAE
ncbi:MAG: hypothetical protein ACJ8AW_10370 [Rhodopila sp.]